MKILIADQFPESGRKQIEALGLRLRYAPDASGPALVQELESGQPEILVVRGTKVEAAHLTASRPLSLVIRAGAGVNTIDVREASRRGIYVANCPGKNAIAVAELAFAHILSIDRRIVDGANDLRAGVWNKKEYSKAEGIYGRRLALLGVGDIGREMILRARAFGLRIAAWSRSLTPAAAAALQVEYAPAPQDAARDADILSVHVALAPETRKLVGESVFSALKPGAIFINTSRGEVVDETALMAAVAGRGLRAGLDVFEGEPAGGTGALDPGMFASPRVQGSHHIGASTGQAQDAVAAESVRIVGVYKTEGRVENCVNLAQKDDATHLLVVRHRDEVGVLAGVLDALREASINVQGMDNILFAGGDAACARIQIEGTPGPALMERIGESPAILAASLTPLP